MKSRLPVLLVLLALLLFYTGVKACELLPERRYQAWILAFFVFFLSISWQFIYRMDGTALSSTWFKLLSWAGAVCLGLWATFMIFSIPIDLGNAVYGWVQKLAGKTSGNSGADFDRRAFLSQWMSFGVLGLSGGIAGLGFAQAVSGPRVKKVTVVIPGLPKALVGLKIAQITDLHVGPTIQRYEVERVVAQVNALSPHLIAITGDLVDGTPEMLASHVQPLSGLKAPLGSFFVTGNHEYYWGGEEWVDKNRQLGFIPLINENKVVTHQGVKILVGGVTDTSSHQFVPAHQSDPKRASSTDEICGFKLLLAHRPDSCFEAEPAGFDLQLSGHTHAGQFFPWNLFVRLAHKYYRGLNQHGKMWVYVNAGTGYWGPVNRFSVPSEITLVELS